MNYNEETFDPNTVNYPTDPKRTCPICRRSIEDCWRTEDESNETV